MGSVRSDDGSPASTGPTGTVLTRKVGAVPTRSFLRFVDRPRLAWTDGTTTVAAGAEAATLTAGGPDRFESVRREATTLFEGLSAPDSVPRGARPRLVGGFAFHEAHSLPASGATWQGYPGALFVLPAVQMTQTGEGTYLTITVLGEDATERAGTALDRWASRLESLPERSPSASPSIRDQRPTPSEAGWHEQVRSATSKIRRGDLRKVVLAQSLQLGLDRPIDVPDALAGLAEAYPGCYRFLLQPPSGGTFYGATPERLVTQRGRTVETEALAGSIGRGETQAEDAFLADQLRDSEKDSHEHALVVDTICDQLDPLTSGVETGDRAIRKLATVQHLQTPIRATLASEEHVLSVVEALHPTPAVGGLPPDGALETIRDAEAFSRGWYAAPVGWFDEEGDGAFAVAIRSALATGDEATLFAGAGIVEDSDPAKEWDELQLKYGPMLDALS